MEEYIRVSTAKARYLGGVMSLRWWYRQVDEGRIPHLRAGGAILLKPSDIEAFIAELHQERKPEPAPVPEEPAVVVVPPRKKLARGGLRFFTQ